MHGPCLQRTCSLARELRVWYWMPGKGTEYKREITFGHPGGSRQLGLELGLETWGEFGHGQGRAVLRGRWAFACTVKTLGSQEARLISLQMLLPRWPSRWLAEMKLGFI